MSDFEDSDEERYANEPFENESDNDVPEIDSDASNKSDENNHNDDDEEIEEGEEEHDDDVNNDDDDDDVSSVKLNTGPIQRNSFSNVRHETDVIPFASSSDEEDDVVVGQTLVEINTPSMHFDAEFSSTTVRRQFLVKSKEEIHHATSVDDEEELGSSDEISEEENEEDVEAEFQRIQEMEEKYILQNSAKTPKHVNTDRSEAANKGDDEEQFNNESDEEEEDESDIEYEEIDEEQVTLMPDNENKIEEHVNEEPLTENKLEIPTTSIPIKNEQSSSIPCNQNSRVDLKGNSYTNLKSIAEQKSEEDAQRTNEMLQLPLLDDNLAKLTDTSIELNTQKIASDVIDALKTTLSSTNTHIDAQKIEKNLSKMSINQEEIKPAAMPDSTATKEQQIEHESEQNNANSACNDHCDETETYYDDQFDYHITSKTPTSFNSDDYIFHANFIKQCQRMNSTDRLRPKPQPRKSMSFSNERMREIERHNQILLRKILTQKPTYNLKSKPSQSSLQKNLSQTNARLTTSAVNRKKQQRQIDLDNQILKKKLESIAVRRRPLMS